MDIETITDTVEQCLNGDSGYQMKDVGFAITALSDLGEIFVRTPGGKYFKFVAEEVSADDIEGWGIDFE